MSLYCGMRSQYAVGAQVQTGAEIGTRRKNWAEGHPQDQKKFQGVKKPLFTLKLETTGTGTRIAAKM